MKKARADLAQKGLMAEDSLNGGIEMSNNFMDKVNKENEAAVQNQNPEVK
jgi:hypothetical protein